MKILRLVIIVSFFAAICAAFAWKFARDRADQVLIRRSLSDQALSFFDDNLKALTAEQIQAQQEEVAVKRAELAERKANIDSRIAFIPFKTHLKKISIVAYLGAGVLASLILAMGASIAIIRRHSIVDQQLSDQTILRVHYRTVKRADFAMFMMKMAEIERVRIEYPDQALKLSRELVRNNTQVIKSFGRNPMLALPEEADQRQDVIHVPTFTELRARGEIAADKPMLFGIDEAGDPVRGSWQDLYSSAIAGQSGNGKSSTARSLILQSLLTGSVEHFFILDPHRAKPEGLVNTLGNVVKLPCITYNEQTFDIPDVLQAFTRRVNDRIAGKETPDKPLVLVIDELLTVIKNVPEVADIIKTMGTAGRGFKCYGMFLAQSWVGEDVGGTAVRDNLTSLIMHKMKRRQAQTMIQDATKARQIAALECGEVLFESTSEEARRLRIPFCSKADAAMMYHELSVQKVVNGQAEYASTVAPVTPGREILQKRDEDTSSIGVTPHVTDMLPTVTHDPGMEVFAQKIKEFLKGNGVTLSKFAEASGVNKGRLSEFLKGGRPLTANMQEQVTAYLQAGNAQGTASNIIDSKNERHARPLNSLTIRSTAGRVRRPAR